MNVLALISLLAVTSTPTPLRVEGEGYLRFNREGRAVFAKEAQLTVKESRVANQQGYILMPTTLAPNGSTIEVDAEGNLYAKLGEQKSRIGRLVLAVFGPDSILSESNGVLVAVDRPQLRFPGEGGAGKLTQQTATPPVAPTPTAPTVSAKGGSRVAFRALSELEKEKITVGEIAEVAGLPAETQAKLQKIDLGPTPMLGIERSFDRGLLVGRIRNAGLNPDTLNLDIPEKVVVVRKGQSIPQSQFIEAAAAAIKQTSGLSVEYACSEEAPAYRAPLGRINLVVEGLSGVNSPTLTALVGIYVEGKRINSRTLRFQSKQNPQAVKAGQNVKVVMRAGSAAVELQGICKTTAPVGKPATVEVRLESGQRSTHNGNVIAEGVVEVRL